MAPLMGRETSEGCICDYVILKTHHLGCHYVSTHGGLYSRESQPPMIAARFRHSFLQNTVTSDQ
ncbi:unnamed protein product [Sphenostylis stenocarpa]|uniref:Uncharacterized protein n=1 Tax=Sphenostylis stenocarpa TaxID=92480 RepID=A0AA86SDY9_9FABA|nr:unnamed protein product [Sphenostylis stenocarpa]